MGNSLPKASQFDQKRQSFCTINYRLSFRKKYQYINLDSDNVSVRLSKHTSKNFDKSKMDRSVMNKVHHCQEQEKTYNNCDEGSSTKQDTIINDIPSSTFKQISKPSVKPENQNIGKVIESSNQTYEHSLHCMPPSEALCLESMSSTSFSSLWLPFKSPFRRVFFPSSTKNATRPSSDMLNHHAVPMASMTTLEDSNSFYENVAQLDYTGIQRSQQLSWAHQYAAHQQSMKPISLKSLNPGDFPISLSIPSSFEGLQRSDNSVIGETFDKFCGIVPPIFQNTVHSESKSEVASKEVNSSTSVCQQKMKSDKKHQGLLPIRINRRGRKENGHSVRNLKNEEDERLTYKKQRAANQVSPYQINNNTSLTRLNTSSRPFSRDRDESPPPSIRFINGLKVTMIDDELKVFVVDLLTAETCNQVRHMTSEHVDKINKSGSNIATWRTLYTYTKRDLPCSEVKGLTSRVTDHIMASIIDIVGVIYQNKDEASKLHPRSWKEPHLLLYQKFENKVPHTGVEMHYDGCDITWNCMLSKSSEYDGGGTYIRALRKTVRLEQGQVLVHPGELYHKGCDITRGERALIVCFMDGFDPRIVDPSSAQEDKESFEKNVRVY